MDESVARDMSGYGITRGGIAGRTSREIVEAWSTYVAGELARFYATTGQHGMMLWRESPRALRAVSRLSASMPGGYACTPDELAAFSGAWHTIASHVVPEFRQWVEEEDATKRLTLTQFAEQYRAAERHSEIRDSADSALGDLRLLRQAIERRDWQIRDAHMKGASVTEIARAIGMTRQSVHGVLNRVIEAEAAEIAAIPAESSPAAGGYVDYSEWMDEAF